MQAVTTIGFDIAKSVFQVHGVDSVGQVIIRRQLKRRQIIAFFQKLPACLVGHRNSAAKWEFARSRFARSMISISGGTRDLRPAKWGSESSLRGRNPEPLMSALGQKQTSAHVCSMSALPPKADIRPHNCH